MHWLYSCPHCKGILNPRSTIILVADRESRRILIGFHPEPGVYTIYTAPGVVVEPGTRWTFTCPLCQADLQDAENADLCMLHMETGARPHKVFFSRVAGRKATYVVNEQGMHERHGNDAEIYQESLLSRLWSFFEGGETR